MAGVEGFDRSLAIVIGIEGYSRGITRLATPANDAKALAKALERDHGFAVELLLDSAATLNGLRTHLTALPHRLGPGDRLLFYFAGHGIALNGDDGGPRGYLLPHDADGADLGSFLPMTELRQTLDALSCRHFLAVFDCCFAGAFRWSGTRDLSTLPHPLHREQFEWYVRDPAWQVFASAAHDQRAADVVAELSLGDRGRVGQHSPFAGAFLDGLGGSADLTADGIVTATELYLYVRSRLQNASRKGGGNIRSSRRATEQTPTLWQLPRHGKGEFVFLAPGQSVILPPAPPINPESNPWRGLEPYTERQQDVFFGRRQVAEKLAERLRSANFTVVVGPSGSGKSSLLRAGALPRVALPDQKDASETTLYCVLRPGASPLAALATALGHIGRVVVEPEVTGLPPAFASHEAVPSEAEISRLLAAAFERIPQRRLLLVVDQLEELLTVCKSAAEAESFLSVLDAALTSPTSRFAVCVAIRTDFEGQFTDSPIAHRWLNGRFPVPPMTQAELRRVIEEPATARVVRFESPDLVDRLIDEVLQMPGSLPLLSFALSELYKKCIARQDGSRMLLAADFEALGGVAGALQGRAKQEYENAAGNQPTMRRVLLRMVSVEGGEPTRRRVPLTELKFGEAVEDERVNVVLAQLVDARLIVSDEAEGVPFAEPAHDALIRGWGTLAGWIRDARAELPLLRAVGTDALVWAINGKIAGQLWYNDPRLPHAASVLFSGGSADLLRPNALEKHFLTESISEQHRRRKWRNIRLVSATTFAVSAVAFSMFLYSRGNDQARMAELLNQASQIEPTLNTPRQADALLAALQAAERSRNYFGHIIPGIRGGLLRALDRARETDRWTDSARQIRELAVPRLGSEAIVLYRRDNDDVGQNGLIAAAWSLTSPYRRRPIEVQLNAQDVALCGNGTCLSFTSDDGRLRVVDTHGHLLWDVDSSAVESRAVDADDEAKLIYFGTRAGDVSQIDARTRTPRWAVPAGVGSVRRILVSSDQKRVLVVGEDETKILDAFSGATIGELPVRLANVDSFALAADGSYVLHAGAAGEVMRSRIGADAPELAARAGNQRVDKIVASRDGTVFAFTSATEGAIFVVDSGTGAPRFRGPLFGGVQASLAFLADGRTLVEVGWLDLQLKLFDIAGEAIPSERLEVDAPLTSLALCRNSEFLAWGAADGRVGLVAARGAHNQQIRRGWTLAGHGDYVEQVACLTDGRVVSVGRDGRILLWAVDGSGSRPLGPPAVQFRHFDLLTDETAVLAVSGKDLWRVPFEGTGGRRLLTSHLDDINRVATNRGMNLIALGSSGAGSIELRGIEGETRIPPTRAHVGLVMALAFSPSGERLASGGTVGTSSRLSLSVWDLAGQQVASTNAHLPIVTSITYEGVSGLLASGGTDGAIRLWDTSLVQVGPDLVRHATIISAVSTASDRGGVIASGDRSGSISLVSISDTALLRYGCARVERHSRVQAPAPNTTAADVRLLCNAIRERRINP